MTPWHGGLNPVKRNVTVAVKYRAPATHRRRIEGPVLGFALDWAHDGGPDDIVEYEEVGNEGVG
jgi:hypothetical protein